MFISHQGSSLLRFYVAVFLIIQKCRYCQIPNCTLNRMPAGRKKVRVKNGRNVTLIDDWRCTYHSGLHELPEIFHANLMTQVFVHPTRRVYFLSIFLPYRPKFGRDGYRSALLADNMYIHVYSGASAFCSSFF